jgi:hypothetical protein
MVGKTPIETLIRDMLLTGGTFNWPYISSMWQSLSSPIFLAHAHALAAQHWQNSKHNRRGTNVSIRSGVLRKGNNNHLSISIRVIKPEALLHQNAKVIPSKNVARRNIQTRKLGGSPKNTDTTNETIKLIRLHVIRLLACFK